MREYQQLRRSSEMWLGSRRQAQCPRMCLLAFPYAGGGASIYRRWVTGLSHREWLNFAAAQLPGRETRILETPLSEMVPLLDELESSLSRFVDLPYVLFGHSMG